MTSVYVIAALLLCSAVNLASCDSQVNIARNKHTNQSSTGGSWGGTATSDKAVDGRMQGSYANEETGCTHTNNNVRPGWWYVDLGDVYRIDRVDVYRRKDCCVWFRQPYIRLSIGHNLSDLHDCVTNYHVEGAPEVSVSCNMVGQFVYYEPQQSDQPGVFSLCEVEVFPRTIDCDPCAGRCDGVYGCDRCHPGKLRPECIHDCEDGKYGLDCLKTCGKCKSGHSQCLKNNGTCADGCELWSAGHTCHVEIVLPHRTTETVVVEERNTSVMIRWEQIPGLPSGFYDHYEYTVQYTTGTSGIYANASTIRHTSGDQTSTDVKGLRPYTSYAFLVTPWRTMSGVQQAGEPYPVISGRTECGDPEPPYLRTAQNITNADPEMTDRILVVWKDVSTLNPRCAALSTLHVEYHAEDTRTVDGESWTQEPANLTSTEHTLSPPYGGRYRVRVTVGNNEGLVASSRVVTVGVGGSMNPEGQTTMIIIVVVVAVVIIAAIVTAVILIRRKRGRESTGIPDKAPTEQGKPDFAAIGKPSPTPKRYEMETDDEATPVMPRKKPQGLPNKGFTIEIQDGDPSSLYQNVTLEKDPQPSDFDTGPVPVSDMARFTANKKKDMRWFTKEYETLPASDKERCTAAVTDENKKKNRFRNIYPYDETRVVLKGRKEDFIHATYIQGFYKEKEYIATQGHKAETVEDLWQMMWQEGANRIVMACNVSENGKSRCEQYWPEKVGQTQRWGDFTVRTDGEEICADYTNRILTLSNGSSSRTIRQFHFTSWEDKKLPVNGGMTLITFHRRVRAYDQYAKGPLVVHCSAGVGRTGTFIAFDILSNRAREEGQVDIYGCVTSLRQQRMLMVQTKEQYFFLHDAIVDYAQYEDKSYPCANFEKTYRKIQNSGPKGQSEIAKQFTTLQGLTSPTVVGGEGRSAINADKNRNIDIVADDNNRPYLNTPYAKGTDYINAVYMAGYRAHKQYIATQTPLPHTVVDFWRLVHDHDCHTIITLDGHDTMCAPFWPDARKPKEKYGPLEVILTNSESSNKTVAVRDFTVQHAGRKGSEKKTVRQFQLLSWPTDEEFPPDRGDLIVLMEVVLAWQQERQRPAPRPDPTQTHTQHHMLVTCSDGVTRCGLYCGATYVLERMKVEQDVDVFLSAYYMRRGRPKCLNSLNHYTFLYEMALEYMARYDEYANFQ